MDNGLLHRADCHANGVAETAARVAHPDLELEPINLCGHHVNALADRLIRQGWVIERLASANDDCDSEVVKA